MLRRRASRATVSHEVPLKVLQAAPAQVGGPKPSRRRRRKVSMTPPLSLIRIGSKAVSTGVRFALPGMISMASSSDIARPCRTPTDWLGSRHGSSGAMSPGTVWPPATAPPNAAPTMASRRGEGSSSRAGWPKSGSALQWACTSAGQGSACWKLASADP